MSQWTNMLLTDSGFYHNNELDKPITSLIKKFSTMLCKPFCDSKVLFIPTAAMQDPEFGAKMTEKLRNELLQMGIQSENIVIYDIDGSLSEEEAMKFDVIYFTGGNTPYLAKRVRETNFGEIIKNMVYANKVYIGMSAGSMLAMANFNVDGLPEETPMDFTGLGLINAYFTVHCLPGTQNRTDLPLPHIAMQKGQALEVSWKGYKLIKS